MTVLFIILWLVGGASGAAFWWWYEFEEFDSSIILLGALAGPLIWLVGWLDYWDYYRNDK